MIATHWEEVKNLFCLALATPAGNRLEFLSSASSSDSIRLEVMRLLEQHEKAGDFLAEPAWAELSGIAQHGITPQTENENAHFSGTARFVVQERLGEGTFGIVYRVLDLERNSMVALKTLRRLDANHLSRFKHEFRSLVDLVHPNLVQLYELFGDDKVWFFTMELVEGVDFLTYTRPRDLIHSWDRIRDALAQLASGVQALHSSARLHRDLKPSNVLVASSGQLLILDFGLVKDLDSASVEQSIALAGSPAYMAPEQVGGGFISAAVDWYAVGVMLFRSITGVLPFEGKWQEVLSRKQTEDAPSPRTLNPDVPEDLSDICRDLLRRDPELRADGPSILDRLQRRSSSLAAKAPDPFVGRSNELNLLRQRFKSLDSGSRQVVLLQGRSGIGKTTLIGEFLASVAFQHPETVILRGRCRESESVPYKALDSVADQLVRYLYALPEASAAALLPRHPALLARIFPCFRELEALSSFPDRANDLIDDQEIRRRAFAALCETLGRISDRQPLIIAIDDLQWGDLDSIALLTELIVPEDAPGLMLILTFRSEDAASSPPVRLLRSFRGRIADLECWTEINLTGLTDEDGLDLLQRLDEDLKLGEEQLQGMVEESRGSPLFLRELLRVTLQDAARSELSQSTKCLSVREMILRRTSALPPVARELFLALSVAVEPLSKAMLHRTVKATDAELSREISLLVHENLVRVTGGLEAGRLEPYHDQVREALLASLLPSELKSWYARLAHTLEAEAVPDPQRLLRYHLGAEDTAAAYQSALAAAKIAVQALAFDQAVNFYSIAIETGEADAKSLAMLHSQRAEALAKAGRGRESAEDYSAAARWPEYNDSFQMRRLAAEQLMRSGYLDEGVTAFTGLLRSVGFWMPETPLQSILAMLALRAFLRLRGMRWRRRHESELSAVTLRNLDLLWSGASVFFIVNPVFGTYLQARHMAGALRAGEPLRLALSVGLGAPFEALGGTPYYRDGRRFLDFAENIASDLQNSHLSCAISVNWIFFDFLCSRIKDGLEHSRRAIRVMSELGIGQAWEGSTAKLGLIWFLSWGGRIRELSDLLPGILDEARSRGDVYTYVIVRCGAPTHLAELAADDPDGALDKVSQALAQWSQVRYDVPHFGTVYASVECELYAGRIDQARKRLLLAWPALKRSLLFRKCQTFRIMLFYMRARTALAAWTLRRDDRILIQEIELYLSLLKKARSPWGTALGQAMESSLEAGRGHVSKAILLLEGAEAILNEHDFRLQAAAISRRRGELEGEDGYLRVQAADVFMRSENIMRPDRITFMILPA
jgi:eukaryotic-like serine/threonine-protein kinase